MAVCYMNCNISLWFIYHPEFLLISGSCPDSDDALCETFGYVESDCVEGNEAWDNCPNLCGRCSSTGKWFSSSTLCALLNCNCKGGPTQSNFICQTFQVHRCWSLKDCVTDHCYDQALAFNTILQICLWRTLRVFSLTVLYGGTSIPHLVFIF